MPTDPRNRSASLPEKFAVRFPGRRCGGAWSDTVPAYYVSEVTLADALADAGADDPGYVGRPGTRQVFDWCPALFTPAVSDPTNKAALDDLAKRLAGDYADGRLESFDDAYSGVVAVEPTALHDEIIITYGETHCQTRGRSAPDRGAEPEEFHHWQALDVRDVEGACGHANNPFIYYYGPPASCVAGKVRLALYKLALMDGALRRSFVRYDSVS